MAKIAVSFYMDEEYRDQLKEIAYIERLSMSEVVRQMIDKLSRQHGMKPVAQTDTTPEAQS